MSQKSPKSPKSKSSSKGKKSISPDKQKSKQNSKKSPVKSKTNELIPDTFELLKRHVSTEIDNCMPDYVFDNFHCPSCHLTLDNFMQFITHECWRKYYVARFDLGETQAFGCRTCNEVFYALEEFDIHKCIDDKVIKNVEDIFPITFKDHFDFYNAWNFRTKFELNGLETNWQYRCRCVNCGNKFPTKMDYLLHSCLSFSQLTQSNIRKLTFCTECCFVFLNTKEYESHLMFCNIKKSFCEQFEISLIELFCQQFVLGRHCYEFHLYQNIPFRINDKPKPDLTITIKCLECDIIYSNLVQYFQHPCILVGPLITPAQLEMIFYCTTCNYMFTHMYKSNEHMHCSGSTNCLFIRLNTPMLIHLALKQWSTKVLSNPYLPPRKEKIRCGKCNEIFRCINKFLLHLCPSRTQSKRLLLQPSALLETYICHECHLILFSIFEAVRHSFKKCTIKTFPEMIQLHYTMDEILVALEPWMDQPQLLQFDFDIINQSIFS